MEIRLYEDQSIDPQIIMNQFLCVKHICQFCTYKNRLLLTCSYMLTTCLEECKHPGETVEL